MNKLIPLLLLLLLSSLLPAQSAVSVSGSNDLEYVYRDAPDSLDNYFKDEFNLQVRWNNLRAGIGFKAELPEFDKYDALHKLNNDDLSYTWHNRFIEYQNNGVFIRGGNFETVLGRGLTLNAREDKDFDIDTRLEGALVKVNHWGVQMTGLYGLLNLDDLDTLKANTVGGFDVEYAPASFITIGGTALKYRNYENPGDGTDHYSHQDVYGLRAQLTGTPGTLYYETATNNEYNRLGRNIQGEAHFAEASTNMGAWRFYSAYKKYRHFAFSDYNNYSDTYVKIHDLPTANYSEEPVSESVIAGEDEEGLQGEIGWSGDTLTDVSVNYSEGWDSSWQAKLSDLHGEAVLNLGTVEWKLEVKNLERVDDRVSYWHKEFEPALSCNFPVGDLRLYVKGSFGTVENTNGEYDTYHYEPYLQTDLGYGPLDLSVIAETEVQNIDDFNDAEYWVGGELSTKLWDNTRIKLFAGNEKGGKVCRNGSCRYQPRFKGARLTLSTTF